SLTEDPPEEGGSSQCEGRGRSDSCGPQRSNRRASGACERAQHTAEHAEIARRSGDLDSTSLEPLRLPDRVKTLTLKLRPPPVDEPLEVVALRGRPVLLERGETDALPCLLHAEVL